MTAEFSLLNITYTNYLYKLNLAWALKTNMLRKHTEFFHTNWIKRQNFWENGHQSFWFFTQLRPWMKVIKTDIKMQRLVVSIITPCLKEISLQMSAFQFNGAYKHGRYERIWLNNLHVMPSVKVFTTHDQPVVWTNMTHYIPYVTLWIKNSVKSLSHNNSKFEKHLKRFLN